MREKDVKINVNVKKEVDENSEQSTEAQAVANETAKADAEVARLGADLEELRQTLQRRQADFENYKKRLEKEKFEESRRATARVIEGLIPVIDSFEHALAAHREAEYENYRRPGSRLIRICIRPWIGRKRPSMRTEQSSRCFRRAMSSTAAC